jgi:Ca2+-binding EF-hand superfamily protein
MRAGLLMLAALIAASSSAIGEGGQGRGNKRFRGLDRDNDGVITRAEWRGSERSFRVHDWNNDGVLSGNEVRAMERDEQLQWDDDTHERFQRRRTEAMFVDLDHNRDGWVDAQEWHGSPERFAQLDDDRNGRLSRSEFLQRREGTTGRTTAPEQRLRVEETRAYGAGYNRGLVEGREAGSGDRKTIGWDLEGQRELEQADSGYQSALGERAHYQAGYRAGFRLGYQQGFGPR